MQKLVRRISLVMVALMTVFTALSYAPAKAATVVPKVQFVGEQKLEYTAGERITFNLNASNYGGRVQYRVVLWNNQTKSYSDLWNTADKYYTNWMPYGNETLPLGWIINQPGTYRITIYAKRAGLANKKTAQPGYNCDSYLAGPAFVIKPASAPADDAAVAAVAAYEAAPLTTLDQVTAAEALKATATTAVAAATDAAKKADLTTRIAAQDVKVAAAKTALTTVTVNSVSAANSTTLKVTFDKDVAATVKNFNIYEKDDQYAAQYVESVSVDKNVATLTLYDPLSEDTNYVMEVKDVKSADGKAALASTATKEFTYTLAEPAKIAFKSTTVSVGKTLKYVIYDKAGNDITSDYTDADVNIVSSDEDVIDPETLKAEDAVTGKTADYSVVNVSLNDYDDVETGDITIKVVETQLKLTSLGSYTVSDAVSDGESPVYTAGKTQNYVYESDADMKLYVEALDQNGDAMDPTDVTFSYKSNNSTILLVDEEGTIEPISTGSATVLVTANIGTTVVRKTYTIEVKADPEAKSLKLSDTAVTLVRGSNINPEVTVTVLDQYGKAMGELSDELSYKIDKSGLANYIDDLGAVSELKRSTDTPVDIVDGKAVITLAPYASDDENSIKGTGKITITYGDFKAYVTVKVVDAAAFSKYVAVVDETKLDKNQATKGAAAEYVDGAEKATVKVYRQDVNGVNYEDVTEDSEVVVAKEILTKKIVDVNSDNEIVPYVNVDDSSDFKLGTENVVVKYNGIKVGTFAITVVDTTPAITTVTQNNDVVQISLDDVTNDVTTLEKTLFGTDEDGAVFAAVDQYGNKVPIEAKDLTMVATDKATVIDAVAFATKDATGTATITFKLAGKLYSVIVKVVD